MLQDAPNPQPKERDIYDEWFEKSVQDANRELTRLRDQEARWYGYQVSHQTLDLELIRK